MSKITIETNGEHVTVTVEASHIDLKQGSGNGSLQEGLPLEEKTSQEPIRRNQFGERLASEKQRYTLTSQGLFREDMTAQEAFLLIRDLKLKQEEEKRLRESAPERSVAYENTVPLPWEEPSQNKQTHTWHKFEPPPKRKRGRPRKHPLTEDQISNSPVSFSSFSADMPTRSRKTQSIDSTAT